MPVAAYLETLVVDDQRSMRGLVRSSLREIGIRSVVECGDGEAALQVLATRRLHLVISDMNMPVMDGMGLLRAMRANPAYAKIAFIMLTTQAEAALVQEAVKLGANNYVLKPFNLVALKKKIEAVFGVLT